MGCLRCGAVMPAEASFCPACGAAREDGSAGETSHAGFWKRFIALFIDGLILYLPLGFLLLILSLANEALAVLAYPLLLLTSLAYFALQESATRQATLGKRAIGIQVTDLQGRRISLGRALGRHVAAALNYLTCYLGWALAGWTPRKQGLHDMLAGTLVVNRPGAGNFPVWAIVLVAFFMLVIPVAGILAAIAIPAYADYTSRVRVSEGIHATTPLKAAVSSFFAENGELPRDASDLGMEPIVLSVGTVTFDRGLIFVTFNEEAGSRMVGRRVALQPVVHAGSDSLIWRCGRSQAMGVENGSTDAPSRAAEYTDVDDRLLPASCRY